MKNISPATSRRLQRQRARLLSAALSALLILAVAPAVPAQTDYASLSVLVISGEAAGPAEKVRVTLTPELGAERTCDTNAEGRCVFGALEPGLYSVRVAAADSTAASPGSFDLDISPGQRLTRSFTLVSTDPFKRGTRDTRLLPQTWTPAAAPLAETVTPGRLGVAESARNLERLPNRDRQFSSLFDRLPGAFNDPSDNLTGTSFNGQPGSQNNLREDGINVTPLVLSSASFQDTGALVFDVSKRLSFKKYKSFQVSTSNYPSDLGTGTGAELIANVEGGGEGHHGEVYEYFAHDALSARNFFDFARKPELTFNLFGVKLGGPIHRRGKNAYPQLFYFLNYEGIRAHSGNTIFAAAPALSARARASATTAPILDSFRAGGATLVAGASTDPNFDILRLDSQNLAGKDSLTARIDYNMRANAKLNFYLVASGSEESSPLNITGLRQQKRDKAYTFGVRYEHTFDPDNKDRKLTNEFIFSVNRTPTRLRAVAPSVAGLDLSQSSISVVGDVPQTGLPGQPATLSVAAVGGLLGGSDFAGREQLFTPTTYSFIEKISRVTGAHTTSFGGELRLIRPAMNQLYGTTYRFASLDALLTNRASVDYAGDLGSLHGGAGRRAARQEYYIVYGLDEWNIKKNLRLSYGLRYEYYSVLREARDRALLFDPADGNLLPQGTPFYRSRRNNFQPRISVAWAPLPAASNEDVNTARTVFGASFGVYTGPDVLDNLLRPVFSDILRVTRDDLSFPADGAGLAASFASDATARRFRPLAISRDYVSPAYVYKFDATVKRDIVHLAADEQPRFFRELFATLSYVGSRSRGQLLRNFANPIVSVQTNIDPTKPATITREFDGRALSPFGEVDYLTTGGSSRFDSLQVALKGSAKKILDLFEVQYTLGRNFGNTNGDDKTTANSNPLDFDYDLGFNGSDVRHKFSFATVFAITCQSSRPCRANESNRLLRELFGGWNVGVVGNFQTGSPIDVRVKRADVVYVDDDGNVFAKPAAGLTARLNVPGGGSSVAAYRPDLLPGVSPYLPNVGDRRFLNPAAFAMPAPGTLGNLPRGLLRGPGSRLVDLSFRKVIDLKEAADGGTMQLKFGFDVSNVFNFTNFKLSSATLPNKLGMDAASNQLQPGQPFTVDAAGDFSIMTRTYKRQQDLGSSRQIQLNVSFTF